VPFYNVAVLVNLAQRILSAISLGGYF